MGTNQPFDKGGVLVGGLWYEVFAVGVQYDLFAAILSELNRNGARFCPSFGLQGNADLASIKDYLHLCLMYEPRPIPARESFAPTRRRLLYRG